MKKQFLLMLLSMLLIAGFFFLPRNLQWIKRIIGYGNNFSVQKNQMNEEKRFERRFGNEYILSQKIADSLRLKTDITTALVLVPPANYFSQNGIKYPVPEPAVFYYFTGVKTTWANSPEAMKANWYVRVNKNQLIVDSIPKKRLQFLIQLYKKSEKPY